MTLVEDATLTLRRGTLAALGAVLALAGPGAVVTALVAAVDPTGFTLTFFVGWFLVVPGVLAATFAAYSTALEREVTARETLSRAVSRWKRLLLLAIPAIVPGMFVPIGAFIVVGLATRATNEALVVVPALSLFGLYVWTFGVVVPATTVFRPVTDTERLDARSKLRLILVTNAPFFPLVVFAPTLPNPVTLSIPARVAFPLWVGGFILSALAAVLVSAAIGVAAVARR